MMGILAMPFKVNIELKSEKILAKIEINKINALGPIGPALSAAYNSSKDVGGDYSLQCNLGTGAADIVLEISTFGLWNSGPSLAGCVAQFVFIIWKVSAIVARWAGAFLDFFVFYSINDTSYRNDFITNGWGIVRDVANIFFIVALLYIAIKTILGLGVSDNKRLVGTLVVVALLINFSLFATKVVIDTSNIVAKIFYTSIVPINTSGGQNLGEAGERSISVGMVRKFNPQQVVNSTEYKAEGGIATFIFVCIFLIALTGYTAYVFFIVALVFLSRVISLWLAMIFSPLAFASKTVSFNMGSMGFDEWSEGLFKNAFLAPIFIFFLYLIVLFLNIGLDISYNSSADSPMMTKLMGAAIPFALLFVLLMTAKKLAIEYSGKMGEAVINGGKMLGGLAGGLALGASALALRGTVGQLGSRIANNSKLKSLAANNKFASGIQKLGMKMESGSFDLRHVKIAGKNLSSATDMDFGDGKHGGFKQAREDKVKARQKRAEELKVGEDEPLTQELHREEAALQAQLDVSHGALEDIEKRLKGAGDAATAARYAYQNAKDGSQDKEDKRIIAEAASQKVNDLRDIKKAIKIADGTDKSEGKALLKAVLDRGGKSKELADELGHHIANAEAAAAENIGKSGKTKGLTRSIDKMEDEVIRDAKNAIHHEDRHRANAFANRKESTISNIVTVVTGGSWKGNREASHKIRMGVKLDSSGKSAGH